MANMNAGLSETVSRSKAHFLRFSMLFFFVVVVVLFFSSKCRTLF